MMLLTMTLASMLCAEAKPEGIRVSTWVREDIFAGFMTGDMVRFGAGMAKVDAILAASPGTPDAVAWRGGGLLLQAVRAFESGQRGEFDRLYALAKGEFQRATELETGDKAAVLAIAGGSYTVFADRVPPEYRREAWTKVRENYLGLREIQKDYFDKLPPHFRGELLAGLAQAEQRLGEQGNALNELIAALPDSLYASRARRWQGQPELASKTSLTCQTCHDAGKLEAVQARAKATRKP